jgi:hypothetical protein
MLEIFMDYYFFFKVHFCFSLYMVGVIWLVQIIHYPLFKQVGESAFIDYHKIHIQKTSSVIAVPMILEVLTGLYLLTFSELYRNNFIFLIAFALNVLIWIVTFFTSVPKHKILSKGANDRVLNALVRTNWIRTIAWTLRALLLFPLIK